MFSAHQGWAAVAGEFASKIGYTPNLAFE